MYLMLFLTFLIKLLFLFSAFMSQYYRCLLPYLKVSCNFTLLLLIVVLALEVLEIELALACCWGACYDCRLEEMEVGDGVAHYPIAEEDYF